MYNVVLLNSHGKQAEVDLSVAALDCHVCLGLAGLNLDRTKNGNHHEGIKGSILLKEGFTCGRLMILFQAFIVLQVWQ